MAVSAEAVLFDQHGYHVVPKERLAPMLGGLGPLRMGLDLHFHPAQQALKVGVLRSSKHVPSGMHGVAVSTGQRTAYERTEARRVAIVDAPQQVTVVKSGLLSTLLVGQANLAFALDHSRPLVDREQERG